MKQKHIKSKSKSVKAIRRLKCRLRQSRKKINSEASSSNYVAVLGSNPTKITIKRCHTTSSSSSSSDLSMRQKSSSTKMDPKNEIENEIGPATSTTSTVTSNSQEHPVNANIQQSAVIIPADTQITKSNEVLDLSTKNAAAHDRKRASTSVGECVSKKPRETAYTQATITPQPPTTVQPATVTSQPQTAPTVQPATQSSQQSSKKQRNLAASFFAWKSANALQQMQQLNSKFKQRVTSLPSTSFIPPVTASISMPPNWQSNYEATIMSLLTFKEYNIDPSTDEYRTIDSLLYSVQINRIKRIVNPDLWKRFISTRREMLRAKSDDLNVLLELGLDERDIMRCTHLVMNSTKDHSPITVPYSDNMALLFHCTKNASNLNNILSQGLDERLSNAFGGRLGKGIYFSDDPHKSLQYDGTGRILIFLVLLGDCISVDHFPFKNALVREPEKRSQEMRNLKDLFFDSIVGRPAGYNEYVIYNRYQCCPLYEIDYKRSLRESQPLTNVNSATKNLPPFTWLPEGSANTVQSEVCRNWPFYAHEIFKKMGASPFTYDEHIDNELFTEPNTELLSTDKKLATLSTLGFLDLGKNRETLSKYNNDIYQTLNHLLDVHNFSNFVERSDLHLTSDDETRSSVAASEANTPTNVISDEKNEPKVPTSPESDECTICYNEYESFASNPKLWQKLKCGHKLCLACHCNIQTTRPTISGIELTFMKCPFCFDITGIQIGSCPDIEMNVKIIPISCEGYESTDTISINYFIDSVYKLNRTAYLPNNEEGKEVLKLLKIAWDRRLCFEIGESVTTGQTNVLVWGIHHKTSMFGGVSSYGYPDPGYMDRVKLELKSFGIG